MSLFYKSNEAKERKYQKENRLREINDEAQQEIVDDQIAEELGLEKQATNLGKLAKRVVEKFNSSDIPKIVKLDKKATALQILENAVKRKKLSQVFNSLKALPPKNQSEKAIQDKLYNPEVKAVINDLISSFIQKNEQDKIPEIVIDKLTDNSEEKAALTKMVSKVGGSLEYTLEENKAMAEQVIEQLKNKAISKDERKVLNSSWTNVKKRLLDQDPKVAADFIEQRNAIKLK